MWLIKIYKCRRSAIYKLNLDLVADTVRYNLIHKNTNFSKQTTQPYEITLLMTSSCHSFSALLAETLHLAHMSKCILHSLFIGCLLIILTHVKKMVSIVSYLINCHFHMVRSKGVMRTVVSLMFQIEKSLNYSLEL